MKRVKIEAATYDADRKKVKAGEVEVDEPETIDEAVKLYGEATVLKRFWDAQVIVHQREIRAGTDPKSPTGIFRKLTAEQQAAILKQAIEQGLIPGATK